MIVQVLPGIPFRDVVRNMPGLVSDVNVIPFYLGRIVSIVSTIKKDFSVPGSLLIIRNIIFARKIGHRL